MNMSPTCAIIRNMSEIIDLSGEIESQLPAELVSFMRAAGKTAIDNGQRLYLVGGVVRDLLLGKANFDLDLVVEGDAIRLAEQLAGAKPGKITTYPQFNTAKIQWDKWSVDLATARSESYSSPGALPTVKTSCIDNDLFRRDFTINAMAIHLSPDRYGELIDLYRGREDLEHKLVRVLHEESFRDDATRIWRGLRYEQRLDLQLERGTLKLLKRDIAMLDTISGDRIRYELECIFKEAEPEKVFRRAGELKVLPKLHPQLKGDGWLAEKFKAARRQAHPGSPPFALYLALLTYRLSSEESEQLSSSLRLARIEAEVLRDTASLKAEVKTLALPELSRSHLYRLLHGYSQTAISANALASESAIAQQHMAIFLHELRNIRPVLTGDDLKKMGIAQGPRIKEILQRLHEARLDGKVTSKQDEEEMVRGWL